MAILSQTQELRFQLIPRDPAATVVSSYTWNNLCTINFRLTQAARLIKLSGFFKPFPSQNDITTPKQYTEISSFNWGLKGRWFGVDMSIMRIGGCQFNCPVSFAALAVATQENWFITNHQPWYERECFFMNGLSIEICNIEFVEPVDISGVPNPPFDPRYLNLDFTLTTEYELM